MTWSRSNLKVRTGRRGAGAGVALAALFAPGAAFAEPEGSIPEQEVREPYHFERPDPGWAVSGTLDLGLSARSVASFGYGKPHWLWVGADLRNVAITSCVAQAVSLRLVVPVGELGVEARRVNPFSRRYLAPQPSYEEEDLTRGDGETSDYRVLEAWLTAYVPVFGGIAYVSLWVDRIYGVPEGWFVYEEITRVVAKPPWVGSEQVAYLFGVAPKHRVGPFVEHVWSSRRSADVVRVGLGYSVELGPHLSFLGYVTEPVVTPDSLGLWEAAGGTALFSYAWSSTDERPGFP
jgi:hypothetical protein